MEVPGRTNTKGDADHTTAIIRNRQLFPKANRRNVIVASSNITDHAIFSNGLYQNVYFIYKMLEIIGFNPILLVNDKGDESKCPEFMKSVNVKVLDEIFKNPIPIYAYIEIGMSIDPSLRDIMRRLGARIIKIYLGNILNIDIETPMFYGDMHFGHHIVGNTDEIWVSPHYEMHREYAAALNKVPITPETNKIAAYVWEPSFLTNFGALQPLWRPKKPDEEQVLLIMEPNISFQKAYIIPLMIAETYYRLRPDWNCKVVIVNSSKFKHNTYTMEAFLPRLDIYRAGRVEMIDRLTMREIMDKYPTCIPICHHYNNEYNYMLFEFFYSGFPVIHNAESWSSAGYFYKEENIQEAVQGLDFAAKFHTETFETYLTQGRSIIWRHSLHNPANQEAWYKLLGSKDKVIHVPK